MTEWEVRGAGQRLVRVIVREGKDGDGPEDAAFTVEIQPDMDAEWLKPSHRGQARTKASRAKNSPR
ncbi:hypothetical protein ACFZDK_12220 [Streptomyces sp. NPDC007901]|uniref:hypothetical protein n=1 Tax=Streptomyces sp. NPDC007901 TaxID=3364785 RepID=UPI0036E134AA